MFVCHGFDVVGGGGDVVVSFIEVDDGFCFGGADVAGDV